MSGWWGRPLVCSLLVATACSPVTDPGGGGDASPGMHILEIEAAGMGAGVVRSTPEGIECGDTCRAEFPAGSVVSLTAHSEVDTHFGGWAGACSGRERCEVTMDGDQSVGVLFAKSGAARWVAGFGGELHDQVEHIVVDGEGRVIVAGVFHGDVEVGDELLMSSGADQPVRDAFVLALDAGGELLWMYSITGSQAKYVDDLAVDSSDDVYVVGSFTGALAGLGCVSKGGNDVYLLKIDGERGTPMWSDCYGGTGQDLSRAVTIDVNGDVWAAYTFSSEATFGGENVNTAGGDDIAISRYSPGGTHQTTVRYGNDSGDSIEDLAALPDGDIIAVGSVTGTVFFGGGQTVDSRGNRDAVVLRLAPSGDVRWARGWGGEGRDEFTGVVVTAGGDIVVGGGVGGPSTGTLGGDGFVNGDLNPDLALARYESDTGDAVWTTVLPTNVIARMKGLALDGAGNPIAVGEFYGATDLGGGDVGGGEGNRPFVAEYDGETGAHHWSRTFGEGINIGVAAAAAYEPDAETLVVGGGFQGTIDFGAGELSSTGESMFDTFLVRLVP